MGFACPAVDLALWEKKEEEKFLKIDPGMPPVRHGPGHLGTFVLGSGTLSAPLPAEKRGKNGTFGLSKHFFFQGR